MKLPKFPWQQPDLKDQLIETYFQALEAYASPANWSDGTLLRTPKTKKVERRWRWRRLGTNNFTTNRE